MNQKYFNIIGLMTGTSMDGIDISLVKTNGKSIKRLNCNFFHEYKKETKKFMLNILNQDINKIYKEKDNLDNIITIEHYQALKNFDIVDKSDLIGFHGQTVYHNPENKISIQLGDPKKLAQLVHKKVVFGFRSNDIKMGGEGAPLAPIYHKLLMRDLNLSLPTCIVNIGGVSNLTYWDGKNLIGYDTGPGNALIDNFMRDTYSKDFDQNGKYAFKGNPDKEIVKAFMNHEFFKKKPPKSLDKNYFLHLYNELLSKKLSKHDTISTLSEFTIQTILIGIQNLPKRIKNIVITGGGCKNDYLMTGLRENLDANFLYENDLSLNFDYIESELIAFLSARTIYNLPITFPSTTGVKKPLSGGKIYDYL